MWFLFSICEAATQVWLGGAVSGALGPAASTGGGGGLMGEVGVSLGRDPQRSVGLQARARELLVTEAVREVGTIDLQVRYPSGIGFYGGLGFAHHHEASLDLFLAHPGGILAGTDMNLTHRSGFEVTGGWSGAPFWENEPFLERVSPFVETGVHILPDRHQPNVYVFLDLGVHLGVGRLL